MLKITRLVFQHLEMVSGDILEKYPQIIKYYTSRSPGIYVLYHKSRPYYIGLATDLNERLPKHRKDRHAGKWETFSLYLAVEDSFIKDLEALLLHIYMPPGNTNKMNFHDSVNIKRLINRKVKEVQVLERRSLLKPGEIPQTPPVSDKNPAVGRKPVLAPYVKKRFRIQRAYKGRRYIAIVVKKGYISFDSRSADYYRLKDKTFTSPSLAASAVTGRPMNGWKWWRFKLTGKGWVLLDKLRKK